MEFIVPLIMFALPVIIAIIDSKNKKNKKQQPQVFAEPIDFDELFGNAKTTESSEMDPEQLFEEEGAPQTFAKPEVEPNWEKVLESTKVKPSVVPAQKNITSHRARKVEAIETESTNLEIDPKKLIIYSEILKPKFDE